MNKHTTIRTPQTEKIDEYVSIEKDELSSEGRLSLDSQEEETKPSLEKRSSKEGKREFGLKRIFSKRKKAESNLESSSQNRSSFGDLSIEPNEKSKLSQTSPSVAYPPSQPSESSQPNKAPSQLPHISEEKKNLTETSDTSSLPPTRELAEEGSKKSASDSSSLHSKENFSDSDSRSVSSFSSSASSVQGGIGNSLLTGTFHKQSGGMIKKWKKKFFDLRENVFLLRDEVSRSPSFSFFVLFYFILFYFILFYFILFYFIFKKEVFFSPLTKEQDKQYNLLHYITKGTWSSKDGKDQGDNQDRKGAREEVWEEARLHCFHPLKVL